MEQGMREKVKTVVEFRNPYHIEPPGTLRQILSHPTQENGVIELAIFQEHRYAFFFWNKWVQKCKTPEPPCLVSLDWHQDLCYPCETEKEWLNELDLLNDADVSAFTWSKLNGLNDGQILAAAYLNLVGNIYVHCRQGNSKDAWKDEELIDKFGNAHIIRKFEEFEELESFLLNSNEEKVFFDIDLDFFVLDSGLHNGIFEFTYLKKGRIKEILHSERALMKWIFKRLEGFTIATEPEHCGGLLKSNKFLDTINQFYFKPELFSPKANWKWKNGDT
ncbi:hypothetical protein [Maribacter zhoushanensis]|uniref:hypothetical protein n=2 Tax=Maribacter TaxID=252356 RepID=UPI0023EBC874|nr:hypothetical protein [Maribacter zhoushanensis]